jgi:hypothetical protein
MPVKRGGFLGLKWWRHLWQTRATSDDAWLAPLRGSAFDAYRKINAAIAQCVILLCLSVG